MKPGYDPVELLPQRLVRSEQWQQWQRRLRSAVVQWQRQAAAEARRQRQGQAAAASEGGQAAGAQGSPAGPGTAAQLGAPQGRTPSPLQAMYSIVSSTPDDVAMRHDMLITVPRAQGEPLMREVGCSMPCCAGCGTLAAA